MPPSPPPQGSVQLILTPETLEDPFYLEIPTDIVIALCLYPLKYLRYIGWAVLGTMGELLRGGNGNSVDLDDELVDQGVYQYKIPTGDSLESAVDLEVIKTRIHTASETSRTRDNFRAALVLRDHRCIWTETSVEYSQGTHIIPFKRGSDVSPSLGLFPLN